MNASECSSVYIHIGQSGYMQLFEIKQSDWLYIQLFEIEQSDWLLLIIHVDGRGFAL